MVLTREALARKVHECETAYADYNYILEISMHEISTEEFEGLLSARADVANKGQYYWLLLKSLTK